MRRFHRCAPLWIALISIAISAVLALTTPLPEPQFHDEFSYLLAADTFARGRLTNRSHELWEFFESFQILQRPTYQGKYQPGQGLVLALGTLLGGEAIAGVWISTALACAAVWWGLRGFVSGRWATIGAIIVATHPLMLKWNWSYWGGAVAVMGGALVVGGIARWRCSRTISAGVGVGVGLFVLAISRPFEGVLIVILSTLLLRAPSPRPFHLPLRGIPGGTGGKTALALIAMVIVGGAWIGYYNWRVAGSAVRLPYAVYEATYAVCPPFVWWPRDERVPEYRHEVMRRYYLEWELPQYERHQSAATLDDVLLEKLWTLLRSYFSSIVLILPVLAALVVRDRLATRALIAAAAFTLIVLGNLWFFPHYAAPAAIVYILLVVRGLLHLRALPRGQWIVRGILALHVVAAIIWVAQLDRTRGTWNYTRADLIASARAEGRKLLVIVRPGPAYYAHNEWVYNDADIDASAVVFARDMGDDANRRLLEYFSNREALLLEIDSASMKLNQYRAP